MNKLYNFDSSLKKEKRINIIAGFDEAGRGPLAGPVFVAGVILKPGFNNEDINDSKKLTSKKREYLFDLIINNSIAYSIKQIDVETIDKINILEASRLGMQLCYEELEKFFHIDLAITDYMKIKTKCELISLAKGDQTSFAIASSSILAKVSRDRFMAKLGEKYPNYGFESNKGYGTKSHIEAIKKYGVIDKVHRKAFEPIKTIVNQKNEIKLF